MKPGIRASFDRLDELEHRFNGIDFPVELALPYRVGDLLSVADRMEEVKNFITTIQLEVLSAHATQGDLAADDYVLWAKPAMELADAVKAKSATFHPGKSRKNRLEGQARVKAHLAEIQKHHRALASVETFGGRDRVPRPNEIVATGIPMVLDTAHLREDEYILSPVQRYHGKISSVHLSARGKQEHHLPIDGFCLEVVSLFHGSASTSAAMRYLTARGDFIASSAYTASSRLHTSSLFNTPHNDSHKTSIPFSPNNASSS
jgi:hypothetical protein